jgi:putative nucleotidyltransferase with HDIG domain
MKEKRHYVKSLFPRLGDINDDTIREKVINVWLRAWELSDCNTIEDISAWPPEQEKLQLTNVEHTNQVVECVIAVADVIYNTQKVKVNMDYLIAAAILHDVDKILLFKKETGQLTPSGKFIAHISLSISLALEQGLPLEVIHAIGTHSPNYSAMPAKTHEALILSRADKMMMDNWIMSKKIDISFKLKD